MHASSFKSHIFVSSDNLERQTLLVSQPVQQHLSNDSRNMVQQPGKRLVEVSLENFTGSLTKEKLSQCAE